MAVDGWRAGVWVASFGLVCAGCGSEPGEDTSGVGASGATAAGVGGISGVGASGIGGASGAAGAAVGTAGTTAGSAGMLAGAGTGGTAAGQSGGAGTEAGAGGDPDAGIGDPDGGDTLPPSANCLQGTGDYVADGPYSVQSTTVTIGDKGEYTIYYPEPLDADCPHPIVAWGNGTTITGGTAYDHFHNHAGSWGIVTIASHNSNVGDGTFQTAAIDYLLEQNEDSSSEFFGKLSARAGVSGHSQGGAGSDRAAAMHDNVEAIVNVQGSFGDPPMSDAAFLCLTGTEDIQPTGCPMAAMAAAVPAMSASWAGADHVSTTLFEGEGIEQYQRLYTAWFRCFLADDGDACALFMGGASCPVCTESGWDDIFANNY